VGNRDFVERARKNRKVLGGGMRQAGIIAAAGIVALDKMVDRLADDHRNARIMAEGCAKADGLKVDLARVQSNMVVLDVNEVTSDEMLFCSKLKEKGVLTGSVGKGRIRLVTHYGIERVDVDKALDVIRNVADELRR
jgi:threonine aldolase